MFYHSPVLCPKGVYMLKPVFGAFADEPVEKFYAPAKLHKIFAPYFNVRLARLLFLHICRRQRSVEIIA